jgi:YbbR domain-containing protein
LNRKNFIRVFTYSYKAKIISIVLAIFLWIHVTAQDIDEQSFKVPLRITGIPDSFIVVNDIPDFMEVTIKETRAKLIKLRLFGKIEGVVDIPVIRKGWVNIPLSANIIEISKDISRSNLLVDEPKFIELNLQRVLKKTVPVKLAYREGVSKKRVIVGDPVIIPNKVVVRGASATVKDIHFLSTNELDLRNRIGIVKEQVKLNTEGYKITVDPEEVLVELEVGKLTVRTITDIPPAILMDNRDLVIKCSPATASITVEGPVKFVDGIVSSDISIILNINDVSSGTYTVEPEVIVPDGIQRYWLDVDQFSVTVFPDSNGIGDKN